MQEGEERVIAYGSYALTAEQLNYCTTRKELLALVRFTRQFRHYLLGRQFLVRTDHNSLRWLLNFKEADGQLARWLEELSQYDMVVKHRPGRKHENADALSRMPQDESLDCSNYRLGVQLEDLPCGGCTKCTRAHKKWSRFTEEVDNVVSLACRQVAAESIITEDSTKAEGQRYIKYIQDVAGPIEFDQEYPDKDIFFQLVLLKETSGEIIICSPSKVPDEGMKVKEGEDGGMYLKQAAVSLVASSDLPDLLSNLRDEQQKDPDLEYLREWLVGKKVTEVEKNILMAAGPAAKFYWINKDLFQWDDNLIWRRRKYEDQPRRLVIPDALMEVVVEMCHNIPSSGHQSAERTINRVKQKYYWYGMSKWITNYVKMCEICNRNKKPNRKARCPLTKFHAGAPLERVHLDFLGPLPKTERGNEHVLMIVDQFTKWVECIPLPSQSAEMTQAVVNDFFSRFGYPFQIMSDQGRNFESKLFAA